MNPPLSGPEAIDADALVGRLFTATIGALELFHVYLGDRLGLYSALADHGALTSAGLSSAAKINERYAREWLEQQAVAGLLLAESGVGADGRAYRLAPAYAQVLLDADSLRFMAPVARAVVGIAAVLPEVMGAFRNGGGVPYEAYGADMRASISAGNRPRFINLLGSDWLPAVPDVDRRLRANPPARVADVGCGTGWSSIAIAQSYPLVQVDGFDLDLASVVEARNNAARAGVADRVSFELRDAGDPRLAGSYDLVMAFETIHDMSDPVGALRAMRSLAGSGGAVLIGDEKVAEEFTAPGDEQERYMYGWSALHCLAVGMVAADSVGTGTVMRPSRLREYALDAGFATLEVLPIADDAWRFYRLSG